MGGSAGQQVPVRDHALPCPPADQPSATAMPPCAIAARKDHKASRDGEKAAGVGDDFEFVREAKMDKLFEIAQFRGKKIKDLFAKARQSEKDLKDLKSKFQLSFNGDQLEDGLVPFNYFDVLKPKSPQEIREILAGYSRTSGGSAPDSKAEEEDGVPF